MTERIVARSLGIKSRFVLLSHNLNLLCAATDEASDVLRRMKDFFRGGCHFSALREAITLCCVLLHTRPHNAVWALMMKAHIVNVHNFDRKCDHYF